MSLSWGTGAMAADLALDHLERRAAVIGCGVVGLTTARQLQRRGFDVTIYTMAVPPDVTSSMSLAGFTPTSGLVEAERRTPEWDEQFRRAAEIAYRQLQLLAGAGYGVSWIEQYEPVEEIRPRPTDPARPSLQTGLQTEQEILDRRQHPFPTRYAIRRTTMRIEPSIYLEALMRDVRLFGGQIVIRRFDAPRDLMTLKEPVIVNCSGLGSYDLFGDREMVPLKGQLTVLVPQPEVAYQTSGGINLPATPGIGIHMMPRGDGIVLGGTSQRGVWTMEPDEAERKRIMEGHIELFSRMRAPR
jgi:glycine/D-amino acid oxidase-like deaminating enzyme